MPTFDTPSPIAISLNVIAGDVRITAGDRTQTTVEVRPANSGGKAVKAAEQTVVEYADGHLTIRSSKHLSSLFGRTGVVCVDIAVPAGSSLEGYTGLGDVHVDGELGECRVKSGYGKLHLARTGPARLHSGFGDIIVDHVEGDADVSTGSGTMRLGHITGTAVIKNSNGSTWIGQLAGAGRVNSANGDITVDRELAGVTAKTANGSIRVGEAVRGAVTLQTGLGELAVGIPVGTAAWLDLNATGAVRNGLNTASGPQETDERVEIRAKTYWGDILIHRA